LVDGGMPLVDRGGLCLVLTTKGDCMY
jgi:hypothetical protein